MVMRSREAKDRVMSCFRIEKGRKIDHFCSKTTISEKISNGFALLSRILRKGLESYVFIEYLVYINLLEAGKLKK